MKKTTLYIKKITKRLIIKMLIPLGLLLSSYTVLAQTTPIPDPLFELALNQLGLDTGPLDGQVLTANISGVTTLDVSGRSIGDLSGIEGFTSLQTLDCSNNNLTALTLSSNIALTDFDASSNNLPTISFYNNPLLVNVDLSFNQLVGVSIKNGGNNNLMIFNVHFNPNLGCVIVDDEDNPSFVFSYLVVNPGIFVVENALDCGSTVIPDPNFEQALIDLGIDTGIVNGRVRTPSINAITTLDVSNYNINSLVGIEGFTALQNLNCDGNNLTTLGLSNNTALQGLLSRGNNLTDLDLSSNTALVVLFVDNNDLRTLNIKNGNNTNLGTSIGLVGNANLNCIVVDDPNNVPTTISANALASATFTDDPATCTTTISIPDTNFEQALIDLGIDTGTTNGEVRIVDIAGITTLDVRNKGISDLTGIEGFTSLTTLSCQLNSLTSLDVSNNTVLEILNCDENDLTSLSLPTTNTLTGLLCRTNEFVTLDFSDQQALTILFVGNNANLEILNIKNGNNTNLTQFSATVNTTSLSCIIVDDASNVPSVIANNIPTGANFIESLSECDAFTLIPDMNFEQALIDLGIDSGTVNGNVLTSSIATITALNLNNKGISDLTGIEDFIALDNLNCKNNNLVALNLLNNTALESLNFSNNNVTEINLSNNTALRTLSCVGNGLTNLDLSVQVALARLIIRHNPNLEILNIKNGNNVNFLQFDATSGTANLSCIVVDDPTNVPSEIANNVPAGVNFINSLSECNEVVLDAKVYLQGAFINPFAGEETLMRDDLRVAGLIPITSPYADMLTCENTVFNTTGTNAIVDWVWIELRDDTDNSVIIEGKSALLQRDGDIVDVDGVSTLSIDITPGNYFIVVNHRNHLGIMSANTFALNAAVTSIDFLNSATTTFGTNARTNAGLPTGVLALWAGNANNDAIIQYSGTDPDTPGILSSVLNDAGNFLNFPTYVVSGYNTNDVDMDGSSQYSGTNPDTPLILQNVLAHPGNFLNFSTYQILEQLPSRLDN